MFTALIALHVITAITLVLIVLLQSGKGAELGAAFGGMGQATSGPGQSTFITKFTTGLAVVFMITSMTLAFLSSDRPDESILTAPAPAAAATAPAADAAPAAGTAPAADAAPAAGTAPAADAAPAAQPAEAAATPSQDAPPPAENALKQSDAPSQPAQ
ncbi:MAG: preprotein translocase subunit SecG [Deltaproteobacteria bacterium]|nr:preprotein translocase subunit SecG [Deltaproteobacteria bacterium]